MSSWGRRRNSDRRRSRMTGAGNMFGGIRCFHHCPVCSLAPSSPLCLRVGRGQERDVVPPPPAQRGAAVLLPVSQRLGQRLPLALGQQQDGEHGQQCQRRVDHVVQEVAVVVPQVHEGRAEAAHAAQGQHRAHPAAPAGGVEGSIINTSIHQSVHPSNQSIYPSIKYFNCKV